MSERWACEVIGGDRASLCNRGVRPEDEVLREGLKALAQERRWFGYRRRAPAVRRAMRSTGCSNFAARSG
jgi:putative transposase